MITPTIISRTGPFVLATSNAHKAFEIKELLGGIDLLNRPESIPDAAEDADTLLGNAKLKAQAVVDSTNSAAISDDSGLFVKCLKGAPGVRTARYAGEEATDDQNVQALLAAMARQLDRRAEFRTVALAAFPNGTTLWVQGIVKGVISSARSGTEGFGYDPVFVPDDGSGCTFAQMALQAKNAVSHRSRAFRGLRVLLGQ